jgi:hypothetical protein
MGWRIGNKMLGVSLSLATAGVLVCASALAESLVPKGSTLGSLAWLAALGGAALLVLVGYVWACDKLESYLEGRAERLSGRASPGHPSAGKGQGKREVADAVGRRTASEFPQPSVRRDCYSVGLRGFNRPTMPRSASPSAAKAWRGQ